MTPEEYVSKMTRLNELMPDDPEPETDAGRELSALARELESYEQAMWPNLYPGESFPAEDFEDTGAPTDEPTDLSPGTP